MASVERLMSLEKEEYCEACCEMETLHPSYYLLAKLLANVGNGYYSLDRDSIIKNVFMKANQKRIKWVNSMGTNINSIAGLTVDDNEDLVNVFYKSFRRLAGKSFKKATTLSKR